MTMVEGEELERLWMLVMELGSQLSSNQALCKSLQEQAEELKGQALHNGTGFALRRFNTDISKEKFESELERLNAHLVHENQTLAHENKQSNQLLREYEGMLDTIMGKFRSFSHASQQHTLALTEHYESLLAGTAHERERSELHANTALSEHLAHLGGLVRTALREIDGEDLDDGASEDGELVDEDDDSNNSGEKGREASAQAARRKLGRTDPFESEGYHIGSPSGGPQRVHLAIPDHVAAISSSASSSAASSVVGSSTGKSKKKRQGYGSARTRDPRWYGTGGYTGVAGDPDAEVAEQALEAHIEEERLRQENETLRELLRVSAEFTPEIATQLGMEPPKPIQPLPPGAPGLSLGKPRKARAAEEEESTMDSAKTLKSPLAGNVPDAQGVASASRPYEIPSAASETTPTSNVNNGVVLDHSTGGAGGPPQLDDVANLRSDASSSPSPGSGVVVTASIEPRAVPMSAMATATAKEAPSAPATSVQDEAKEIPAPTEPVPLDTEAMLELADDSEDPVHGTQSTETAVQAPTSSQDGPPDASKTTTEEDGATEASSTRSQLLESTEDELKRAADAVEAAASEKGNDAKEEEETAS